MKCKMCSKVLYAGNKSGYCYSCYTRSPQSLLYQRNYQREMRKKPSQIKRVKEYLQRPEVKKRRKKYMEEYVKTHRVRIRELKRNWARKNKEKKRK